MHANIDFELGGCLAVSIKITKLVSLDIKDKMGPNNENNSEASITSKTINNN